MLDGVQVSTHAGVLFRVSFLRLVPLMDVSMSVTTETRYTLGISRCYIDRERTDGEVWGSPGEVFYVHQHGVLLDMQFIPY